MPVANLEINFFSVALPDARLPFFCKNTENNEVLQTYERQWDKSAHPRGDANTREVVLIVDDASLSQNYESSERMVAKAQPSVVKALLESGLRTALKNRGYHVIPSKMGFSCFNPQETVSSELPDFLTVRRGVEFHVDYLSGEGQRLYGFFVSTKVRQEFRISPTDTRLLESAKGERVYYIAEDSEHSGILLEVSKDANTAYIGNEDKPEIVVELSSIKVPASREIVDRYCRLINHSELRSSILKVTRASSYRWLTNGRKNPRWLADQYGQIRSWLISASVDGRIRFFWANSSHELYLQTRGTEVSSRGAQ